MDQETITHTQECEEYGTTCVSCDAHSCTERLDGAGNWRYSNVKMEEICSDCYDSDIQYPSQVILFTPGSEEPEKYFIGSYVTMDQYGDDAPSGMQRVYHSTDAWRGYYDTEVPGTIEINSGADLWGEMTDVRTLAERIQEEHAAGTLPVPVYVICDPTSNVFAVAMTIKINPSDRITFDRWLKNEEE
jgi:hypothetical protein